MLNGNFPTHGITWTSNSEDGSGWAQTLGLSQDQVPGASSMQHSSEIRACATETAVITDWLVVQFDSLGLIGVQGLSHTHEYMLRRMPFLR